MKGRSKIVLATDSLDPSGMGEHMITLARALSETFAVRWPPYTAPTTIF